MKVCRIKKFILENYKKVIVYSHFQSALRAALKVGVAKGTFIQVKQSFKLSPAAKAAAHRSPRALYRALYKDPSTTLKS